jgi:peptidoglycan hydrolase-like protein with peptidoglycan-binding domain
VQFFRASVAFVLFAALAASPAVASRTHRASTGSHAPGLHKKGAKANGAKASGARTSGTKASGAKAKSAKARRPHGQQAIDPARVTEIQQALIREHYLSGEADGKWDAATIAAMQKFQADQGWQTRLMPDSRALKKLGLGPDYSGAINAKNSSFADPPPVSTLPPVQAEGFAAAAGVNR